MLEELREELAKFSSSDLLAKVGALSLLPENASRAISLDALAHVVASQPDTPGRPIISANRLRSLMAQRLGPASAPGRQDDTAAQMFTAEVLFSGGAYIVFPGIGDTEQDLARWLLGAAVLGEHPLGPKDFRNEVSRAAILCLSVSNAIATAVGMGRRESPGTQSAEILIPGSSKVAASTSAITFSRAELADITLGGAFLVPALGPLTTELGSVDWGSYSFGHGQLHHAPFVHTGDSYIVPAPSLLLTALRHRVLAIAKEHGVLAELADAYRSLIWAEVRKLLGYGGSTLIPGALPNPAPGSFIEGLFTLDSDKALYVQLATDDRGDFLSDQEASHWDVAALMPELEHRAVEVIPYLRDRGPGPDRVLILTILQPLGRALLAGFGDPPDNSLRLAMSASDLRAITLVDAGDPLCLWKFARAHHRIRDTVQVMSTDLLDEYEMYRSSQHSYYFADDKKPNFMLIAPGAGLDVRRRVIEQIDPHGVSSFHQGYLAEVYSVLGEGVPISTPPSQFGKVPALVVEGALPIPVWVLGPESAEGRLRPLVGQLVETLAYWIWQFELLLAPALALVGGARSTFVVEFMFDDPAQWEDVLGGAEVHDDNEQLVIPSAETTATGLKLTLHSSLLPQLGAADNRGERQLVAELLRHIKEALRPSHLKVVVSLADSRIEKAIGNVAPLGQKKKMFVLPLETRQSWILGTCPLSDRSKRRRPKNYSMASASTCVLWDGKRVRSPEGTRAMPS